MSAADRYDISELPEAHWEPGSRGRVFRNLRGITSKKEMDRLEAEEQYRALRECIATFDHNHRFSAADNRDYRPMTRIFEKIIERSLRNSAGMREV